MHSIVRTIRYLALPFLTLFWTAAWALVLIPAWLLGMAGPVVVAAKLSDCLHYCANRVEHNGREVRGGIDNGN